MQQHHRVLWDLLHNTVQCTVSLPIVGMTVGMAVGVAVGVAVRGACYVPYLQVLTHGVKISQRCLLIIVAIALDVKANLPVDQNTQSLVIYRMVQWTLLP